MSTISAQARRELIKAIRDRYLASSASEKRRILDGFVALTGYHRKHAIRVLRSQLPAPASRPPRPRIYDEAVVDALVVVWEAADRCCGKRLKPLLPILVAALEGDGRLSLDASVRSRLLAVSAATIDRLLANQRAAAQGPRRTRRARPRASRRTATRTFADRLAAPAIDEAMTGDPPAILTSPAGSTSSAPPPPAACSTDEAHQAALHRAADLDRSARGLAAPARRAVPKPPRHWRTRVDPFAEVWPRVVTWLEAEPGQTAKLLLRRLQDEGLGEFPARQLRTLQRRIRAWRRALHPVDRHDEPGSIPE